MFKKKKVLPVALKYKMLEPTLIDIPDGRIFSLYRIQALQDIPLHGVKAGDLGGYVQHENILSHEGSCWVGGSAVALAAGDNYGYDIVHEALVTENAFTQARISGSAKIYGEAKIFSNIGHSSEVSGTSEICESQIFGTVILRGNVKIENANIISFDSLVVMDGDISVTTHKGSDDRFIEVKKDEKVELKGKLVLDDVTIRGNCKMDAEINLHSVSFKGNNTIFGKPQIKPNVKFTGTNVISGSSLIPPSSHVHDVIMDRGVLDYSSLSSTSNAAVSSAVSGISPQVTMGTSASNEYVALIEQIGAEYEAYTTDIVKLIKYPAMVDTSIPEVRDFVVKLRSAKRAVKTASEERLADISEALETAFVCAENKVQTLVSSHLDENKKKSLKTAEKMFSIACDDASPEPEKRLGYKAGIRALEGIVLVSDVAKENMKARVGILELEA